MDIQNLLPGQLIGTIEPQGDRFLPVVSEVLDEPRSMFLVPTFLVGYKAATEHPWQAEQALRNDPSIALVLV